MKEVQCMRTRLQCVTIIHTDASFQTLCSSGECDETLRTELAGYRSCKILISVVWTPLTSLKCLVVVTSLRTH